MKLSLAVLPVIYLILLAKPALAHVSVDHIGQYEVLTSAISAIGALLVIGVLTWALNHPTPKH